MSNIKGPVLAGIVGAAVGGLFYILFAKAPKLNNNDEGAKNEPITDPTSNNSGGNNTGDNLPVGTVEEVQPAISD